MMYDLHYSYLVMGLLYRNWSALERELMAEPYRMPRQSELAQEHLAIIARANAAGPHSSKWTNGKVARQVQTTLNALVEEQIPNFEGLSARVKCDYDVVMRFGRPDEASRHTSLTQAQKEEIVEKMTKDLGYNEETVRLCVDRDCTAP
ncbi:hypothetical protein B0A54_17804 [Friedmanniomyces endolithicus]|uniref:Uncharacterized protein n=1 Tax=Friedmanniomyces endolithicus TaxID=329885 RepID=A0A4U0TPM5_9PEZI|nr:hypothetical protein B0A54_17804 [Friedmanniomyces endolithicus]